MLKVPLNFFKIEIQNSGHEVHINEQPDIHPENFRALALTVLAGEATRRKKMNNLKLQLCRLHFHMEALAPISYDFQENLGGSI